MGFFAIDYAVHEVLGAGGEKARASARLTMDNVRKKTGFGLYAVRTKRTRNILSG